MNASVYILVTIICLVVPAISVRFDCGCDIKQQGSSVLANCSNRKEIDYPCLSNYRITNLLVMDNNLTEVPRELYSNNFAGIYNLNVSRNRIKHIPDDLSEHLPRLKNANFNQNNISDPNQLLRLNKEVTYTIDDNPFKCNYTDPKMTDVIHHIKAVGIHIYL